MLFFSIYNHDLIKEDSCLKLRPPIFKLRAVHLCARYLDMTWAGKLEGMGEPMVGNVAVTSAAEDAAGEDAAGRR